MIDIRQTIQYANYLSKIGWTVEIHAGVNYFIKKIPIIGSIIKIQRPEEIRNKKIKELVKSHRAFQIIIEPKTELDAKYLISLGFRLSKSPYLPTKTIQLDLTRSRKQLFNQMQKDARHALRRTMHYELCSMDSKIEDFRNAWKKSVGLKRYVPPLEHLKVLKKSFKNNCVFLACFDKSIHRSELLAGAIFLIGEKMGYYWQAFTNKEGRKGLYQYKIVLEGILWAKKRGAKIFDFEGIYDERFPNKSWKGFTHFKKSFGGYEIEYPGTFIKNRLPL